MSVINREFEVSSSLPADKLFKLCLDFDTLAPKIEPQAFKAIDLIKAVPFTSAKYKIDAIDARNFSATYTVFEGDALLGLDSATHHFKLVPSADGGAVFKDSVVFKGKGDAKPTEETLNQFKELLITTYKAHEAYAIVLTPEV
ncbi:root allergen protein-like protein [Tanacetum coccineum]